VCASGACRDCGAGAPFCAGGACAGCRGGEDCDNGQACCGGACVDLGTDANCGGCGDACGATQLCDSGTCVTGRGTCAAGANVCLTFDAPCNGDSGCFCLPDRDGATRCARYYTEQGGFLRPCGADEECADLGPGAFCPPQFNSCGGVCSLPC
jgi:hypothetical protein